MVLPYRNNFTYLPPLFKELIENKLELMKPFKVLIKKVFEPNKEQLELIIEILEQNSGSRNYKNDNKNSLFKF
jgi:F0F1-type ATP synthase delta subunit